MTRRGAARRSLAWRTWRTRNRYQSIYDSVTRTGDEEMQIGIFAKREYSDAGLNRCAEVHNRYNNANAGNRPGAQIVLPPQNGKPSVSGATI